MSNLTTLLNNLGIITRRVRRVLICGGGMVGYYLAARLEKEGRYTATRRCIQHGKVSVYAHCVSVADTACVLAETLHLRVNERALIRGALLHDYFLYDWL